MRIAAPFTIVKHARQRKAKLRHRFNIYGNAGPAHTVAFLGYLFLGIWGYAQFSNYRPTPFKLKY